MEADIFNNSFIIPLRMLKTSFLRSAENFKSFSLKQILMVAVEMCILIEKVLLRFNFIINPLIGISV